jgi:hypothetical protein
MAKAKYIRRKVGAANTVLIALTSSGGYLVKGEWDTLDALEYSDATLPASLREKLGLLKLVQPNHTVPSIGHRISEGVFLIDLLGVVDE